MLCVPSVKSLTHMKGLLLPACNMRDGLCVKPPFVVFVVDSDRPKVHWQKSPPLYVSNSLCLKNLFAVELDIIHQELTLLHALPDASANGSTPFGMSLARQRVRHSHTKDYGREVLSKTSTSQSETSGTYVYFLTTPSPHIRDLISKPYTSHYEKLTWTF